MSGGVREIPLTKGYVALVDAADFERLGRFNWHAVVGRRVYAKRALPRGKGGRRKLPLQNAVLDVPAGVIVDHVDGDTLNCRRGNLRVANNQQNQRNKGVQANNRAGYKGVSPEKRRWRAVIHVGGKQTHLGNFLTPVDAARAYDAAARQTFGEFARLNFPEAA